MRRRWYRLGVLILWGVATFWLVAKKILPPLLVGEPPVYVSTVGDKPHPTVGWHLNFENNRLGFALSAIGRQSTDVTEIHSLVHIDEFPFNKLFPSILRPFLPSTSSLASGKGYDVESHMLINPLNQLQSFDSKLKRCPHTGQSLVAIEGNVEGDKLNFTFRYGEKPQEKIGLDIPENKIRDCFSPETELRNLHLGQSWTIVSYSPMSMPTNPLELLQHRAPTEVLLARVEEQTELLWNGKPQLVWRVVYRSDASEGSDNKQNIRNQLWVRVKDGLVLRQEVHLMGNSVQFIRMSERELDTLHEHLKQSNDEDHKDHYQEYFGLQQ
jgi:hypothetical protein